MIKLVLYSAQIQKSSDLMYTVISNSNNYNNPEEPDLVLRTRNFTFTFKQPGIETQPGIEHSENIYFRLELLKYKE